MQSNNSSHPDRNPDGTFTKGSELAKELGAQGGHAAHEHQVQASEDDGVSIRRSSSHNRRLTFTAQPRRHLQGWQQACA